MKKEKIIETIEFLIQYHQNESVKSNKHLDSMFHSGNLSAYKQVLSMIKKLD